MIDGLCTNESLRGGDGGDYGEPGRGPEISVRGEELGGGLLDAEGAEVVTAHDWEVERVEICADLLSLMGSSRGRIYRRTASYLSAPKLLRSCHCSERWEFVDTEILCQLPRNRKFP